MPSARSRTGWATLGGARRRPGPDAGGVADGLEDAQSACAPASCHRTTWTALASTQGSPTRTRTGWLLAGLLGLGLTAQWLAGCSLAEGDDEDEHAPPGSQ